MRYRFEVVVSLKPGLLDPQGKAVEGALPALGWTDVSGVRVGKHVELTVEAPDEAAARARVEEVARRLLANPVIEDHRILLVEEVAGPGAGAERGEEAAPGAAGSPAGAGGVA